MIKYRLGMLQETIMDSAIQLSKEDIRKNKPSRDEYLSQPKLPLILVLGNERKGVSEAVLHLSH